MTHYKLNEEIEVIINREEADFDRACDEAVINAHARFGVDVYGHINNVEGAERSDCSVEIKFVGYRVSCDTGGQTHYYHFKAHVANWEE